MLTIESTPTQSQRASCFALEAAMTYVNLPLAALSRYLRFRKDQKYCTDSIYLHRRKVWQNMFNNNTSSATDTVTKAHFIHLSLLVSL